MVSIGRWRNWSLTLSIKQTSVTVSLSQGNNFRVYSFDLAGRWWTAMIDGVSYRRGLNGRVVAKWFIGKELRDRKWLSETEAEELEISIRSEFVILVSDLSFHLAELHPKPSNPDLDLLKSIANYSISDSQIDINKHSQVYRPIGILPPDQYMAVVLQATEGCSFNNCTFCTFYQDRPFRIKSQKEFKEHIHSVKHYLGSGLNLRRTIFIGDANALVAPMKLMVPMLELVNDHFDVDEIGGIFAFLDGFSGDKKSAKDYKILNNLGVKRVYIGLESGNERLLKFLNKPGKPSDVLHAVRAIKSGGISVGIILLLGAGGRSYSTDHIKDSVSIINQMNLDLDDLIYFSELIVNEGTEYSLNAYQANLIPLTDKEKSEQAEKIESGFHFSSQAGNPHISRYDIREFVY